MQKELAALLDLWGCSANELARRLCISPGYVSEMLRGVKAPSVRMRRWVTLAVREKAKAARGPQRQRLIGIADAIEKAGKATRNGT